MKKILWALVLALLTTGITFVSCQKDEEVAPTNDSINDSTGEEGGDTTAVSPFVGVYELDMVYDSIMTSDGSWFSEEFFEQMTHKVNPPEHGYLTVSQGSGDTLRVTATFIKANTGEEKDFFSTTAVEKDGGLVLAPCTSDYYYASTELYISFVFRNFVNNLPEIRFKSVYSINLGADFSYVTSYTCVKR